MENAISFYTDWDIYESLTKENQIIESFESLSQSHRVCGNPCMRRSSALHCQVGKRMGGGSAILNVETLNLSERFVCLGKAELLLSGSVGEQATIETSKHDLWGSWVLNDSFRACESNISMASRRRKKCEARDGLRRDPNVFQRTTCIGKIWLPWRFYLPAYY